MDIFNNRKGVLCAHPVALFVIGFVVGVLFIYLVAKGTIPLAIPIC